MDVGEFLCDLPTIDLVGKREEGARGKWSAWGLEGVLTSIRWASSALSLGGRPGWI